MNTEIRTSTAETTRQRKTYPAHAIKVFRVAHGLTSLAVATRAGMSQARVSRIECGLVAATPAEIAALRDAIEQLASARDGGVR